jgi:serine/threonine protein kinase
MALPPGTRLGFYEVAGLLGAGGMGEVYRARDTKLNREVALKVLPDALDPGRDRIARFEREAQLLASLNHPNIAAIYGIAEGHAESGLTRHALVLEIVEGPTLADRLARGPVPLAEARDIAAQVANALEAAHERGIIHRDLKPANIKVRPDGTVKVLDFGLAKALEPDAGSIEASRTPTITSPAMTAAGLLLGTAAYMSPEQARGQTADARSDVWAFGCVLFEMLSGTRAFPGETVTDTLASVLRAEPEWGQLPPDTPEAIRRLLRRSLQKDRGRRLADIRDARLELAESDEGPAPLRAPAQRTDVRERLLWSVAVAALAAALVASLVWRDAPASNGRARHLHFDVPPTTSPASIAIAPDGRHIVYVALAGGVPQLWLYTIDSGERRALRGTAGASYPFWSPDSQRIGFFTNELLYVMGTDNTPPRPLAFAPVGAGGAWSPAGTILFAPTPDSFVVGVDAETGASFQPPGWDAPRKGGQRFPQFLPDDRHYIYFEAETGTVWLGDTGSDERRPLLQADGPAMVAPPDELLFVREGLLFSQQFDSSLAPAGEPVRIGSNVAIDGRGAVALSASHTGSVLYRTGPGGQPRDLVVFNRSGAPGEVIVKADPGFPLNLDLSPDDSRVIFNSSESGGNTGIVEMPIDRRVPQLLTRSPAPEILPVYSCDGADVLYALLGGAGGVYRLSRSSGKASPVVLAGPNDPALPLDWSCDGHVLYRRRTEKTGWDIWALRPGTSEPPALIAGSDRDERIAQFSPDGAWIAYESGKDGVFDIFVQQFPEGQVLPVSKDGGSQVRWQGDEIFYVAPDGRVMHVSAISTPGGGLKLGAPSALFAAPIDSTIQGGIAHTYAVFSDGQRFLLSTYRELSGQALTLILDRHAR